MDRSRVLVILFLLLALAGVSLYYLGIFGKPAGAVASMLSSVPDHAPILVQSKSPSRMRSQLNVLFSEGAPAAPALNRLKYELGWVDSLVARPLELSHKGPFMLWAGARGAGGIGYAFMLPVSTSTEGVLEAIRSQEGVRSSERIFRSKTIHEFSRPGMQQPLALAFGNGYAVMGFEASMIEETVDVATRRKNGEGRRRFDLGNAETKILAHLGGMEDMAGIWIEREFAHLIRNSDRFGSRTELRVQTEPGVLKLHGNTVAPDSTGLVLASASGKATNDLLQTLPFNTGYFLEQSGRGSGKASEQGYFDAWMQGGQVYFVTEDFDLDLSDKSGLLIGCSDSSRAMSDFVEWSKVVGKVETVSHQRGLRIMRSVTDTAIMNVFPNRFVRIANPFFAVVDNMMLLTNTRAQLETFVRAYRSGRTLGKDSGFQSFEGDLASGSDYFLGINRAYLREAVDAMAPVTQGEAPAVELERIGLQFGHSKNALFTQAVVHWKEIVKADAAELWTLDLGAAPAMPPTEVVDHRDGSKEVLIQDAQHVLRLIDRSGSELWKRTLDGPVMSEIFQIDFYQNGKLQYAFNTAKNIHLLDRQGKNVGSFPIRLPVEASNGMLLVNYDNAGKYRLFVACKNESVYGYYKTGKPLKGWHPKKGLGTVEVPLKHFAVQDKDYVVVQNDKGVLHFFNRRGEYRFAPVRTGAVASQGFALETSDEGFLLSGVAGNDSLLSVNEKGELTVRRVQESPLIRSSDRLLYSSARSGPAYWLSGKRGVYAYDSGGKKLWSDALENAGGGALSLFSVSENLAYLGCLGSSETAYLFSLQGHLHPEFPIHGVHGYFVSDLFGTGEAVVVYSSRDGQLTARRLN